MSNPARDKEALRQQMLLRALWRDARPGVLAGWTRDGPAFARGLQAYQANAGALAERALAAAFPTVQQLVGDESFAALARALWQARPPLQGDMARWGAALPGFMADAEQLAEEPYLADVARLDWAVHLAQTAADATAPVQGLALLGQHDPGALTLRAQPGTGLVSSPHPVLSIWQAHRSTAPDRFDAVRAAFAAQQGEGALVWRRGWAVEAAALSPAELRFTASLLQGASLGVALAQAGPALDFEAWLIQALQRGWLAAWHTPLESS